MQQKEVLIVIGVVLVGFLLLKSNVLSGKASYSDENSIYSFPQGYDSTDAYSQPQTLGLTSGAIPCPGSKVLSDFNCDSWLNYVFTCRNANGGVDWVPCHCSEYKNCGRGTALPTPLTSDTLFTATLNAVNNMGEFNCPEDCVRSVFFGSSSTKNPATGEVCVEVSKTIVCTPTNK